MKLRARHCGLSRRASRPYKRDTCLECAPLLHQSFKTTQNSNDYIVVVQDHFPKWVDGRTICGKEALNIPDAVVQGAFTAWSLPDETKVDFWGDVSPKCHKFLNFMNLQKK